MWILFFLYSCYINAKRVSNLQFLGPFLIGKTEIDGDSLRSPSHNCTLAQILRREQQCPARFPSEIAQGGYATWMDNPQNGLLPPHLRSHQTSIVQQLNRIAAFEFSGWATATLTVPTSDVYRIQCRPAHTIYVDGTRYEEDIYGRGIAFVGLYLTAGNHELWVRIRARHTFSLQCNWEPANDSLYVLAGPIGSPTDLVAGKLPLSNVSYVAFSFNNMGSERFYVTTVHVVSDNDAGKPVVQVAQFPDHEHVLDATHAYAKYVAPLHTILIPIAFELDHTNATKSWWQRYVSSETPCLTFTVSITGVSAGKVITSNVQKVELRCRTHKQSVTFTFMDADNSVTNAAIIRPQSLCPSDGCPIVLSLCGVGATARSQADAHKYQPAGKRGFIFGFPHAWVLSPFREGAHNGEGTGFWTPIVALRHLQRYANESFKPDLSRVVYAGHSRGGHWAYTLAQHSPSNALAVMSASGYGDREDYGDANMLFEMDLQLSFMSPIVKAILEATLADHDNHALAGNLKGVDVLVRVGGNDATVSPYYQRRMNRVLTHSGVNVTFEEIPGKDHWWWDTVTTSDGGVMHDEEVRNFMTYHFNSSPIKRINNNNGCVLDSFTLPSFVLTSWNPATQGCKGGVTILQMYTRLAKATLAVEANLTFPHLWSIFATNVKRFRVAVAEVQREETSHSVLVMISKQLKAQVEISMEFCHDLSTGWNVCPDSKAKSITIPASLAGNSALSHYAWRERASFTYGPARMVFANPFIIVVGTQNPRALPRLMAIAKGLSLGHNHASFTTAPVLLDTDLSLDMWKLNPISLLLVGGPSVNMWSERAMRDNLIPVHFAANDSAISIASCRWDSNVAIGFTFPLGSEIGLLAVDRPYLSFMLAATQDDFEKAEPESLLVALTSNTFSVNVPLTRAPFSNMFPDWMIIGRSFASEGYGGVLGTGFWNNQWSHDASNGFLDPTCAQSHLSSCAAP